MAIRPHTALTPPQSAFDMLRGPTITIAHLKTAIPALGDVDPRILERVEIEGEYYRFVPQRLLLELA
jgi:hypothetical protein